MTYDLNQIPSEAQIKKMLRQIIFGKNIYCPICKNRNVVKYTERYRCRKCDLRFSLLSHTWLKNMKLTYREFWLILWCWLQQIPVLQAQKLCHLSEKCVRHWYDNFRNQLPELKQPTLSKLVQLDEAYFGGKNGRALLMAKEVGISPKLAFQILPKGYSPVREDILWFLETFIEPDTTLNTDGSSLYWQIDKWWPVKHQVDIHKKFEFGLTSQIEGTFGNLRTFIRRMYHHVTIDKLESVVSEFCFRFSHKEIFENPRCYLEISLRLLTSG